MQIGRRGLGFVLVAVVGWMLSPSAAIAGDTNAVPPKIKILPGGEQEGAIGAFDETIAYFETEEPNTSWAYTADSKVSFTCLLDGQPVRCAVEHSIPVEVEPLLGQRSWPRQGSRSRRGPYMGGVPVPKDLARGPHMVTIVATDEDGVDPSPPAVTVVVDRIPPTTPELVEAPPRTSRDRKPQFRFTSTDDHSFPDDRSRFNAFKVTLRRVRPPRSNLKGDFRMTTPVSRLTCFTIRECSASARPVYWANAPRGLSFSVPELLDPGLYEFRVGARDSVGNKSAAAKHRFRILRSKQR